MLSILAQTSRHLVDDIISWITSLTLVTQRNRAIPGFELTSQVCKSGLYCSAAAPDEDTRAQENPKATHVIIAQWTRLIYQKTLPTKPSTEPSRAWRHACPGWTTQIFEVEEDLRRQMSMRTGRMCWERAPTYEHVYWELHAKKGDYEPPLAASDETEVSTGGTAITPTQTTEGIMWGLSRWRAIVIVLTWSVNFPLKPAISGRETNEPPLGRRKDPNHHTIRGKSENAWYRPAILVRSKRRADGEFDAAGILTSKKRIFT
jgi:hypothetical protein